MQRPVRLPRYYLAQDMSQLTVGVVMDRLLVDEALRHRFAIDPVETLGELQAQGCALTPGEIDLFLESDVRMWSWIDRLVVDRFQ